MADYSLFCQILITIYFAAFGRFQPLSAEFDRLCLGQIWIFIDFGRFGRFLAFDGTTSVPFSRNKESYWSIGSVCRPIGWNDQDMEGTEVEVRLQSSPMRKVPR